MLVLDNENDQVVCVDVLVTHALIRMFIILMKRCVMILSVYLGLLSHALMFIILMRVCVVVT
jgi:phosphoenolpyruvate synthase/pyruvate phosphate dikinase